MDRDIKNEWEQRNIKTQSEKDERNRKSTGGVLFHVSTAAVTVSVRLSGSK